MAIYVSNVDLTERVCHLTNKIYLDMLYIKRDEGKTHITMGGLVCWTPKFSTQIVLSWYLLAWMSVENRIPYSFTNFITTAELSGPFHISPDFYHTQVTEYSLDTIHGWVSSFLFASKIFLIVIPLDPPPLLFTVFFSIRTGLS